MKKSLLLISIAIFSLMNLNAQETSYGVTLGYHNVIAKASFQGISSSSGESGLFVGFFADFVMSDKLHIQPELHYGAIFANGETGNELILPIMVKYYAAEKFFVQAGPQFDYILDKSLGVKKLGFGLGFGAGYDFTEKLFATARYSLGLNNRLDENIDFLDGFDGFISFDNLTTKFNFFQIGVGYRFN